MKHMDKFKPAVPKTILLLLAGIVWECVGLLLLVVAFSWLATLSGIEWYVFSGAGIVLALGVHHFGFLKIVDKNLKRILEMQGNKCLFAFFPRKSYLVIVVMVLLGKALRQSMIPKPYLATVYIAIGLALVLSSIRYLRIFFRETKQRALPAKLFFAAAILVGMPLAGLALTGISPRPFLAFPPRPQRVAPAPFSWPVFWGYAVLIGAAVMPLAATALKALARHGAGPPPRGRWPWWGTLGLITGGLSWILAWTRFPWFAPFQPHTFVPLWLSYIALVNALTLRRSGRCMLTHRPAHLGALFAASAVFWWFFEYLNRFAQNWYYTGAAYGPWTYTLLATASFATVLPAVLGTRDWLASYDLFRRGWQGWPALRVAHPRFWAAASLAAAAAAVAAIAVRPDLFFALVWVAPLIVVASLQTLFGRAHVLSEAARGNWAPAVSAASAALVCGFFWEMWNAGSLVGWTYSVPYVQRFDVFAMPLLGYAGYLPFGLECAVAEELVAESAGAPVGGGS